MNLEKKHFGEGYISLIAPSDNFPEDDVGFQGPEKIIPEIGTARIVAWDEVSAVDGDLIIDPVKNIVIETDEYMKRKDLYEFNVFLSTESIEGNISDLLIKAVMPDGNIYESGLGDWGLNYDEEGEKEGKRELYRGIFCEWRQPGYDQVVTLAVPADPSFLSQIGFSFSYIL